MVQKTLYDACEKRTEPRANLTETGANLTEPRANLTEPRANLTETRANLTETGANLTETRANLTETGANLTEARANLTETRAIFLSVIVRIKVRVGINNYTEINKSIAKYLHYGRIPGIINKFVAYMVNTDNLQAE